MEPFYITKLFSDFYDYFLLKNVSELYVFILFFLQFIFPIYCKQLSLQKFSAVQFVVVWHIIFLSS